MAAVGGGIKKNIGCRRSDGSVKYGFEGFVSNLTFFKRQVVTKNNKAFRPLTYKINDIWQMQQVYFINLDQFKSLVRKMVPAGFDKRGFTGATRTRKQHIICFVACDKLRRVAQDCVFLSINILQRLQRNAVWILNCLKITQTVG